MKKIALILSLFLSLSTLSACGTETTPSIPSTDTPMKTSDWKWDGKTLLSGKHTVVLKTSKGDIELELNANVAPKTVTNFMAHAASGYYDNLTFHRVIPGFMIQGGDPSGNGTGGVSIFGEMFEDEIDPDSSLYSGGYKAGTIAMANRGPNTNGSQFFIMDTDYPLPPNYTIFGSVTKGQSVVNAIARVDRDGRDMPKEKVTFSAKVIN